MSIKKQIDRISSAKAALVSSIEAKGVTVPASVKIDELPSYVEKIETETGSACVTAGKTFESVMLGRLMRL